MRYLIAPLLVLVCIIGCESQQQEEQDDFLWLSARFPGATNITEVFPKSYEFDYKGKRIYWRMTEVGGMVVLGDSASIQAVEVEEHYYKLKKELEELEDKRGNAPKEVEKNAQSN